MISQEDFINAGRFISQSLNGGGKLGDILTKYKLNLSVTIDEKGRVISTIYTSHESMVEYERYKKIADLYYVEDVASAQHEELSEIVIPNLRSDVLVISTPHEYPMAANEHSYVLPRDTPVFRSLRLLCCYGEEGQVYYKTIFVNIFKVK